MSRELYIIRSPDGHRNPRDFHWSLLLDLPTSENISHFILDPDEYGMYNCGETTYKRIQWKVHKDDEKKLVARIPEAKFSAAKDAITDRKHLPDPHLTEYALVDQSQLWVQAVMIDLFLNQCFTLTEFKEYGYWKDDIEVRYNNKT